MVYHRTKVKKQHTFSFISTIEILMIIISFKMY